MRRHRSSVRFAAFTSSICVLAAVLSCGHTCGLGLHEKHPGTGTVACCGASFHQDFALTDRGDGEFNLTSTRKSSQPLDAFLVPATCEKLFDGPYPGSPPLCDVLIGPVATGAVTARVKLRTGTYRLWVQGYNSNIDAAQFLIDINGWDYRCLNPLQ
jgi:hypothetical protein